MDTVTFSDSAVYLFVANIADYPVKDAQAYLSADELTRMQRFQRPEDKKRYLVAHLLKRLVLSRCLCVPSDALTFATNQYGKPLCLYPNAPEFNISHSQSWVVIALSKQEKIGVDLEFLRKKYNKYLLLQRFCSEQEIRAYFNTEVPDETFLCFWTQKEALGKMLGFGLSKGLKEFFCSGRVGKSVVKVDNGSYYLSTLRFSSNGVLSYACSRPEACHLYRLQYDSTGLDGFNAKMLEVVDKIV